MKAPRNPRFGLASLLLACVSGPALGQDTGVQSEMDFARALGRALRRPAFLPTPAFALRLVFGELADELLLASQRARPARLQSDGYAFRWPDLDTTLSDLY